MRRGPLTDSYPAAVALVVCALVPYLALTASLAPLGQVVGKSVGLSRGALELTTAMSDAGYAIGTVIAVQVAQHLPPRRMLIAYVTAFVVFAVLAAWAPANGVFVAAVPPLVTGFGADKMASTGVIMNLCIFGAVAAGPSIGGFEAGAKSWHPLFWTVAGVGAAALVLALLFTGLAAIVVLIVHQYRARDPLMPVRQLATTFPVTGILIALAQRSPTHVAALFLPELGAAVLTAAMFRALFRTRFTPVYAAAGLVVLAVAAAVLVGVATGGDARILAGSGLPGLGVGAAVSPGLFIAGFSLRSKEIQRVFALIGLLRGVTAFLVAPVLLYLVALIGLRAGVWICLGLAAGGAVLAAAIFLLGRARLQTPDLERWQEGGEPAWDSPPLLQAVSGSPGRRAAEPERAAG